MEWNRKTTRKKIELEMKNNVEWKTNKPTHTHTEKECVFVRLCVIQELALILLKIKWLDTHHIYIDWFNSCWGLKTVNVDLIPCWLLFNISIKIKWSTSSPSLQWTKHTCVYIRMYVEKKGTDNDVSLITLEVVKHKSLHSHGFIGF